MTPYFPNNTNKAHLLSPDHAASRLVKKGSDLGTSLVFLVLVPLVVTTGHVFKNFLGSKTPNIIQKVHFLKIFSNKANKRTIGFTEWSRKLYQNM